MTFFEVDLPDTQAAKRARAPTGGPIFVAADVTDGNLLRQIAQAGYDSRAPTAFTIEGVTMYLSQAHVTDLLKALAHASSPASRLAVNFGVGFEQSNSGRGRLGRGLMASGGESFRFRLSESDAPQFLKSAGWEIEQSLNGQALRERFLTRTAFRDAPIADSAFVVEAHPTSPAR